MKLKLKDISDNGMYRYNLIIPYPHKVENIDVEVQLKNKYELTDDDISEINEKQNFVFKKCNEQILAFLEYSKNCYVEAINLNYDVPADKHIKLEKILSRIITMTNEHRDRDCFMFIVEKHLDIVSFLPCKKTQWNDIIPESFEFYITKYNTITRNDNSN